jgi:hypothetical protein
MPASEENISGAPFPRAKRVTPATLSDILIFLDMTCKAGQKLKNFLNFNFCIKDEMYMDRNLQIIGSTC